MRVFLRWGGTCLFHFEYCACGRLGPAPTVPLGNLAADNLAQGPHSRVSPWRHVTTAVKMSNVSLGASLLWDGRRALLPLVSRGSLYWLNPSDLLAETDFGKRIGSKTSYPLDPFFGVQKTLFLGPTQRVFSSRGPTSLRTFPTHWFLRLKQLLCVRESGSSM